MTDYKPIPIGIEDFKEIIDKGYYFVDKTTIIKDILDSGSKVTSFTRPRRFGKTLNMSMLRRYFEKTVEDNSYLFDGLKISGAGEKYQKYMGQYPVISISLKSMKQASFEESFFEYQTLIIEEFEKIVICLNALKSHLMKEISMKLYAAVQHIRHHMLQLYVCFQSV